MDSSSKDIRGNSFKKWSETRFPACNDDDDPDHDNTAVIRLTRDFAAITRTAEQPYSPWLVPGVGISI
jgi:hypothetical protein